MPNRVLKDSIWSSPTLAKLSVEAQLHWPRLLLMADDWGCFNADADVVLGLVYPKMKGMTTRKIDDLLAQYVSAGLLFLWADVERRWGFFTSWNGHQYCNATNLDDSGKQQRHRRRTPEPPEKDLSAHLKDHSLINQVFSGKLEQSRAACNNSIIPIPIPNPNPKEPPLPPKGDAGFDQFWQIYPKKKAKGDAEKVWKLLNPNAALQQTIRTAIGQSNTSPEWTKDGGQFIPYPARWLRTKGWEDEATTPLAPPDEPGEFDHLPKIRNEDYWICGCPKASTDVCRSPHHGMTLEESYAYIYAQDAK